MIPEEFWENNLGDVSPSPKPPQGLMIKIQEIKDLMDWIMEHRHYNNLSSQAQLNNHLKEVQNQLSKLLTMKY